MSDVLLSSLCFLYGDVGQHRRRVYWHQWCGGEAQEGDEQALLPKEVKILQCVRQNDESWYPNWVNRLAVVERTWPWQCCSMTDTGHTGHTGHAAELLFKQTDSVLLPQTQRQKTFTPHAATFYNPIYLPQRSACDLLPPTTQSKSQVTVIVIRHYKQNGIITMMMISATVSASCFIFILLCVSDVNGSPRDGHFWAFP